MSFVYQALASKPARLWNLDDDSPFQDYSGANGAGSVASLSQGVGLTKGALNSAIFSNTNVASFDSPVFQQGAEAQSFTLEAWVYPVGLPTAEVQVLGHTGKYDGILLNGTKVIFTTKYLTAGEARIEYDLQKLSAIYVVALHSVNKNSLYVNGALVGEINITDVQQADKFVATDGKLYSGQSTVAQSIMVNGIGIYTEPLTATAIMNNYLTGTDVPDDAEMAAFYGGTHIPVSLSNASLFIDHWWSTQTQWLSGAFSNTAVVHDQLVPQFDDDTSVAGNWVDTIPLATDATSIFGIMVDWDGEGATVEVSLDGTTWEQVTRGARPDLIPAGFDPTGQHLEVRVSFPGGIVDDTSYVDNLNIVGMKSAISPMVGGRTITFTNAVMERDYPPLALNDNWGVELDNGTITISADTTDTAAPIRTVEMWVKPTTTTAPAINVGGVTYLDAIPLSGGATWNVGQWRLCHIVLTADMTTDLVISGSAQIGSVTVYDTALAPADIDDIFANYTVSDPLYVNDVSILTVIEPPAAADIYAHDWTILSSG